MQLLCPWLLFSYFSRFIPEFNDNIVSVVYAMFPSTTRGLALSLRQWWDLDHAKSANPSSLALCAMLCHTGTHLYRAVPC